MWQPIETAPKDGTRVLLFTTHIPNDYYNESFIGVQIGRWDCGHMSDGWEFENIGEPTHWMPLPPPPEQ